MEGFIIEVLAKIAKYTVRPVGRWLCYSWHYKSNMDNMKNQETMLRDAQKKVERKVEAASNNNDRIHDDVETWLTKVHQLDTKKLAESRNSNPSCLNLKQRHQMSREAKQMVGNIAELLKEKPNLDEGVSYRPTAQEMVTPRNVDYMTLDSRISITKRIMDALGDANINKIGVWGSPGVGKSTLMKEIFKKAKEESLFDEVALANVTDSPNLSGIQGEIADMLDLKLDPNCKTEMVRAGHLRKRLEKDKEKKILVILDDIWKRLDLEEIGITPSERCKVLLTSRHRHVLASDMGTGQNSFKLDILGQEEAWNLFEKMAGDSVKDDHDLRNAANEVAKACGGLPIALVTVSRALKNKNLGAWKDALVQLTRPTPEHDTKIWLPVYSCIELSYKHLDGSELQSFFLLCARQGYYISYRDLLRYGFGLRLFRRIDTLQEARNRLETLVRDLQDACLLLQSPRSSEEFYMHDLVRHVATIIASNDDHNMFVMRGYGGQKAWPDVDALKRCEALSIHSGEHIHKYPNKIECPKLRYFHVQCEHRYLKTPSSSFQGMDKLEDIFFQGMEKLEVLSLTNIQLSSLLPLTNLQTLCLDGCELGDIHWIGELKTLVILSLANSDISNLPGEIGSLTGLRLLDLTDCFELTVIPPNVLSSLVKLEELYMRNIDVQWEVDGPNNEGQNASVAELKHLSHLITLEIDIKDAKNLPKDLFSEKLERYKICIVYICIPFYYKVEAFSRSLALGLNRSFQLDFGIKMLLKRTEYLFLDESNSTKSVFYELDREDFQQLKHLHIRYGNIKHIPELRTPAVAFPILETFVLEHMISLEEICQGNLPLTSFKNLKVLKVENCEKLRFIFSSSIARGLSLLEELNITRCNNVGAIFVKEEEDGIDQEAGDMMLFCRLQTLVLSDLPKLVSFLSPRETNSEGNDHDLQLPLLHHQLSFPSLKNLHLQHLPKIKHVWSNVNGCESLKSLVITYCGVMEEIVAREDGTDPTTRLLFPSLTLLRLNGLPKLKWFFQGVRTLESSSSKELHEQGGTLFGIEEVAVPNLTNLDLSGLPIIKNVWSRDSQTILNFQNLQEITARKCASLESLFPASVGSCLKQLKKIIIDDCGVMEEIFSREDGTDPTTKLLFPSLYFLTLAGLPKLKWFFQGVRTLESSSSKELHEQGGTLFGIEEVAVPNLTYLDLSGLPIIKHVWSRDSQTILNFQNLQEITVRKCASLESLFPASVGSCLKQLKKVIIDDCGVMEEIVSREDGKDPTTKLLFPSLYFLTLAGLPKLKWFFQGVRTLESSSPKELHQQGGTLFGIEEVVVPNLTNLDLSGLPIIKHVWSRDSQTILTFQNLQEITAKKCASLESLFPVSVVSCLKQLKKIIIDDCGVMEEIVSREDGTDPTTKLLFPSLYFLTLARLPKLKWFFQGVRTLESSSPKELHEQGGTLFGIEEVAVPNLTNLDLSGLPIIKHVWSKDSQTILSFQNLQEITAKKCASLESLFPASVGSCLKQLKVIRIVACGVLEEIVGAEGGEAVGRTLVFVFPQVTSLNLKDLPRLECFYKGVHISKWPMLKSTIICGCKKVEVFASGLVSKETVEKKRSQMSIKQPLFLVDEM